MATSESDDFESANEDTGHDIPAKRRNQVRQWSSPTTIDSESDDDTEFVPRTPCTNFVYGKRPERFSSYDTAASAGDRTPAEDRSIKIDDGSSTEACSKNEAEEQVANNPEVETVVEVKNSDTEIDRVSKSEADAANLQVKTQEQKKEEHPNKDETESVEKKNEVETQCAPTKPEPKEKTRPRNQRRPEGSRQLGAKKLGTRLVQNSNPKTDAETKTDNKEEESTPISVETLPEKESFSKVSANIDVVSEDRLSQLSKDLDGLNSSLMDELIESDMPEELKSNKKFKEVFKPEGWEALGNDIELPEELTEEKLQPVLERLSLAGPDSGTSSSGWGGWGNWGMSSLINTATAGVSTITSHVSHGLTLLEETIAVPEPSESTKREQQEELATDEKNQDVVEENQLYSSFGFGNLISGVSSITKLVESTSSKVVTGGLDTLEAIGKKTMEVLQEGDPGLKKKRAFFTNEADKPILSQILREAKDKAESAEKSFEEKQMARKLHFETLFDDYQGLVHLEALEMLSRQSNMKIEQHLMGLELDELTSVQETLEEVVELFDLEDDEDEGDNEKDLKVRLQEACDDLGVHITYDKLYSVWEESQSYLAPPLAHTDREIFQSAISALAQFTAFSVERFHKTAELLLIKERRSTVNEADALVRLTRILSNQIGILADCYCTSLREIIKTSEKSNDITASVTTVTTEAGNASSYVEDALRLLIPIVQVGAI